jgi:hypothetical protein
MTPSQKGTDSLFVESGLVSFSELTRYFEYDLATPRRSDGPEV